MGPTNCAPALITLGVVSKAGEALILIAQGDTDFRSLSCSKWLEGGFQGGCQWAMDTLLGDGLLGGNFSAWAVAAGVATAVVVRRLMPLGVCLAASEAGFGAIIPLAEGLAPCAEDVGFVAAEAGAGFGGSVAAGWVCGVLEEGIGAAPFDNIGTAGWLIAGWEAVAP